MRAYLATLTPRLTRMQALGFWRPRQANAIVVFGLFLGLFLLDWPVQAAGAEEAEQEIAPVATEIIEPTATEVQAFADVPALPTPPGPISTLDPEVYAALKAAAAVDPNAEIPDAFVRWCFHRRESPPDTWKPRAAAWFR